MVSFDVVSLFTAIPVDKACCYIKKKLENDSSLQSRTKLDIEDICFLLNFVLSNNYFMFNDKIYKKIHSCAMGSPISPVVANLCMEEIKESAISASSVSPKVWKRYVNNSFCIITKDEISSFHNILNSFDPYISFTIEHENNGQIPSLDTLVSRHSCTIYVDVYKKPTHTHRYLDFNSHHDIKHKESTTATLLHRALNLPDTTEGRNRGLDKVYSAFQFNRYPSKFIHNNQTKEPVPQ